MASDTGLSLNGKQIQRVSPNMTHDEMVTIINDMVDTLNNYSRDVVLTGVTSLNVDGTDPQVVKIEHGLGYAPKMDAYLNQVSIGDSVGDTFSDVNLPLPTWLSFTDGGSVITYRIMLDFFTDDTYLYFRVTNSTGAVTTTPLTINWSLTRLPAVT